MENSKKTQIAIGKVVKAFVNLTAKHPELWKDENWDDTYGLVDAIGELVAVIAGGVPDRVIDHIMEKCGRK